MSELKVGDVVFAMFWDGYIGGFVTVTRINADSIEATIKFGDKGATISDTIPLSRVFTNDDD